MIPLFAICSAVFLTSVFAYNQNPPVQPQGAQIGVTSQGFDPTLGNSTDVVNKLIIKCSNYLPMVDSYMKSQLDNPEFLSGGTDVVILQVSMDTTFNACKNTLNVIAAYQLVISEGNE